MLSGLILARLALNPLGEEDKDEDEEEEEPDVEAELLLL